MTASDENRDRSHHSHADAGAALTQASERAQAKRFAKMLRREVAEMMSELEIAMAQREARVWVTAH